MLIELAGFLFVCMFVLTSRADENSQGTSYRENYLS